MVSSHAPGSGVVGLAQRVAGRAGWSSHEPVHLAGGPLHVVGTARTYVCGITPYDVTHLGHASTFVWADLLASAWKASGVDVDLSRNVTDVDDVLTRAAESRGRYFDEFALTQEFMFQQHMTTLRVAAPTSEPRARHHVAHVQQLAHALLQVGAAYERDGRVMFRGAAVIAGAGLGRDEALHLCRVYGDDPDDVTKDDPFDVPVWRPSGAEDPAWPSPWGWGRPGWHAECAAMALAVHGSSVDVVVGGDDLTFPHHAYQSAMVESVTGVRPFARRALHVGSVRVNGARMAKSTGNLVLVDDLLAEYEAPAVRLMLLDRDYARAWDYEPALLASAQERLERLYVAAARTDDVHGATEQVLSRLRDDLDVPAALDAAERHGGEAARRLLTILRLG